MRCIRGGFRGLPPVSSAPIVRVGLPVGLAGDVDHLQRGAEVVGVEEADMCGLRFGPECRRTCVVGPDPVVRASSVVGFEATDECHDDDE